MRKVTTARDSIHILDQECRLESSISFTIAFPKFILNPRNHNPLDHEDDDIDETDTDEDLEISAVAVDSHSNRVNFSPTQTQTTHP